MEHLTCGGAINIAVVFEDLGPPGLVRETGEHPGFNGRKVADDEFVPRPGDKGSTDQLREDAGNVVV